MSDPDFLQATRSSYDTIAPAYSAEHPDGLGEGPVEGALLAAFAELVRTAPGEASVADVGSGPGYVTARLNTLGLQAYGIDISPHMVALAREAHPGLRFEVGSMTSLDVADGTLGGIIALYSTIHVPDAHLPGVFTEFHRVLRAGGYVLLAFQASEGEQIHMAERYGQEISLDYYFRTPAKVCEVLAGTGFSLYAQARVEAQGERKWGRAFVLAQKVQKVG
ncbi:class I SAM-dependent methyltransferase [Streptomyces sp. NPDC101175]|uniref:class I SAM-dependent methyltransferase n=1 Tax=Streptomyces sp. NPDC101175 TaxID=3366123 RepID=UPI003839671B